MKFLNTLNEKRKNIQAQASLMGRAIKAQVAIKNGIELPAMYFAPTHELCGVKVYIKHDQRAIDAFLSFGAGALKNDEWGDDMLEVLVDDVFQAAPESVKMAILAHEVGHKKMGHLAAMSAGGKFEVLADNQAELDADRFSQENGYDMISALQWIISAYPLHMRITGMCSSIEERIAALQLYAYQHQATA